MSPWGFSASFSQWGAWRNPLKLHRWARRCPWRLYRYGGIAPCSFLVESDFYFSLQHSSYSSNISFPLTPWWDYAGPVRKSSGRPLRGVLCARETELDFPLRLLLDYPFVGVGQPGRWGGVGRKACRCGEMRQKKGSFYYYFCFPFWQTACFCFSAY